MLAPILIYTLIGSAMGSNFSSHLAFNLSSTSEHLNSMGGSDTLLGEISIAPSLKITFIAELGSTNLNFWTD